MVAYDQSYYGDSFPVSSLSISIWIKEVPIYKWGIVDGYVHRCLFSVHCHLFCVNLMKGFPLIGWAWLRCAEAEHCWYDCFCEFLIYWHFIGCKSKMAIYYKGFVKVQLANYNWQNYIFLSHSFIACEINESSNSMTVQYLVCVTIISCFCLQNLHLRFVFLLPCCLQSFYSSLPFSIIIWCQFAG